jgi:hypothetical protein
MGHHHRGEMSTTDDALSARHRARTKTWPHHGDQRVGRDTKQLFGDESAERPPALVGDEAWGPLLLRALFRPPDMIFADLEGDEASEPMNTQERHEYMNACKDLMRTLVR